MQKRKDARRKDTSQNVSALTLGQSKLYRCFLLTLEVALTVLAVLLLRNPFRHFWQCPLASLVLISGLPCYGKPLRPFLTGRGLAMAGVSLNSTPGMS